MKKFKFSLDRMLDYQQQNMQKEKNVMGQIMEQIISCENQRKKVETELEQIHADMDREIRKGTTIYQIRLFTTMIENGKRQLSGIKSRLNILEQEKEKQREIVVEASKEVTKLEKLKEKQWEEYRHAEAKEQELVISEHVAGQFIRQGGF